MYKKREEESDREFIDRIMDGYEKEELKNIRDNFLRRKKDFVIVVDGVKGTGKSTFGLQACKWIDPSFNAERVHFDGKKFLNSMKTIKKGQAIQFDEAIMSMLSRNAMKKINKKLMIAFNIFRKKAAFIILCIPHIKNLDKSIRNEHVFSLVHIKDYKKSDKKQLWQWYSRKRLQKLINNHYNYKSVTPNKYGWFYDFRPFENEYEKKKDKAINKFLEETQEEEELPEKVKIAWRMCKKLDKTQKEAASMIGVSRRTIATYIKKVRENGGISP